MRGGAPLAAATAALALAFGIAACGEDDERVDVSVPSIEVPGTAPTTPTTTTPTITAPTETTGGTGAGTETRPDSPQNDVPPPPGSAQEKFEQFCKQNPEACG